MAPLYMRRFRGTQRDGIGLLDLESLNNARKNEHFWTIVNVDG